MGVCAVASESNDQRRVSKELLLYGFLSLFRIVSSLALLKWASSSFILHY
jgi:hypothetical protein